MAGKNTIEAKLRIAADFADAVRDLKALRAEMKAAGADAKSAGGDATGAKAVTQAQKDSTAAARAAATEQRNLARETAEVQKKAAKDAAAEVRKQKAAEAEAARKAAAEARKAAAEQAATAKAAAKAARLDQLKSAQLAPQVTDIVTGLASGQSPLLVALQQGGQLRDVFGGVGNAVRALLGVFTLTRVAIGGVLGVAVLLGKAFVDAKSEADQLNRSLNVTGNIAATNVGQVNKLAQDIATQQKVSVGSVRETLNTLADTGQFTFGTLAAAGRAVTAYSKATGRSAEESIKLFDDMSAGVAAWAVKTNQQYNFLTEAQFKRIRSLEAEGRTQEASRVALEEFAKTMEQRAVPSTNALERAWAALGRTVSNTWDSIKGVFRDETPDERIAALTKRIEELKKVRDSNANLGSIKTKARSEVDALQAELDALRQVTAADAVRRQERAAAQQAENEKIQQASKSFQDALAGVDAAGAQKRLATELAALDQRRAAVELDHKRGLTGELEFNLALNAIEQQRLQAQAANLQRQIEIERGRVEEKPEDGLAKQARAGALEAQLTELRSRINQAASAGRGLVEADALDQARETATEWAKVWQRSFDFVRQLARQNAADQAAAGAGTSDPAAQARAAADAKTEQLRQQTEELRRALQLRLDLTIDPAQKAALEAQLADLARESATAIETAGRRAQLESLRDDFSSLQAALQERLSEIDQALANGALTSAEAEREAFAARAKTIPQLERILALIREIATTPGEKKDASQSARELDRLKAKALEFELVMRTSVRDSFAQTFTDFVTGAKSAAEAFRDFIKGVLQAVLNLIARRLGEQLADSIFGKAGSGANGANGGGWGSALASFFASFFHGGGVVGGLGSMTRAVSPMVFATAARYHSGGIAGLAADEVPAVLRKGEEVLTADDPRHRNNGGGAAIGNMTVNVSISTNSGAADENRVGERLAGAIKVTVANEVIDMLRPGGLLAGRG